MSYAAKIENSIPLTDYLAAEESADARSEYVAGQVYAMAGGSELHNTIASEFHTLINAQLPDECRAWQSDMKVLVRRGEESYAYYPDIMASCEANDSGNPYIRTNPSLIVEVLSSSTKRVDLGEKLQNYISLPSLMEYVVVSQDTPYLRLFRRRTHWQAESYYAEDTVKLESVGLEILVERIYRRVRKEVGLDIKKPT